MILKQAILKGKWQLQVPKSPRFVLEFSFFEKQLSFVLFNEVAIIQSFCSCLFLLPSRESYMRNVKMFLCAATLTCFAAGCSDSDSNTDSAQMPGVVDVQMNEIALTEADVPTIAPTESQKWGNNLNAFGADFMHEMNTDSSFVYSPFSLHTALSMAASGAKGTTLIEMASVLHVSSNVDDIASDNGAMSIKLRYDGQNENSKFDIANRIWVDQTADVVPAFKQRMNDKFKAPVQIVDFINHSADVVGVINQWVSNITHGLIPQLLNVESANPDTRMILVNAIYFNGKWAHEFEKEATRDEDFYVKGTETTKLPMMHQTAHVQYYENDTYQAIILPYKEDKFSMVVMLPLEKDKLPVFMDSFDENVISHIVSESRSEETVISLPKFKIETKVDNAVDILKTLGMKLAFANFDADFSQMITSQSGHNIYISKVNQKAVIDVFEEGTEAAAATAIGMDDEAASIPEYKYFKADHPFAFAIIHNESQGIMFAGQYVGE